MVLFLRETTSTAKIKNSNLTEPSLLERVRFEFFIFIARQRDMRKAGGLRMAVLVVRTR